MNNQFIGVLSGTSMDAIDVALVAFNQDSPQLLATTTYPIPPEFRAQCFDITYSGQCSLDDLGTLDANAGILFAEAVLSLLKQKNISPKQIRAIGSHGQNLRHSPHLNPPFTLQIGDPNIIAERTGIPTVADFRRRDIAAGGQGAPLAPGFHANVFKSQTENRVIINIGGISNVTFLPASSHNPITGFDTGPGNCLMDIWMLQHLNYSFDKGGRFASSGTVHPILLQECLQDPYFSKKPPKSTGREYFNDKWLNKNIHGINVAPIAPRDIQATLLALTAYSIGDAILQYGPNNAAVFVCGGGTHNTFLIETLKNYLQRPISSTETLGVPPDWVEAMLFAWLAKQTLEGKTGNCPTVTGAKNPAVLGGIFGYSP